MSVTAPEPPARGGGGGLRRTVGGLPVWGWITVGAAALGAIVYFRIRGASSGSSSTATQQGVTQTSAGSDQTSLSEYEQITSQLTGIEGNNAAILAAIKDLQGKTTTDADSDRDTDTDTDRDRRRPRGTDSDAGQDSRAEARQDRRQRRRDRTPTPANPPRRPGPVRRKSPAAAPTPIPAQTAGPDRPNIRIAPAPRQPNRSRRAA